MMQLHDFAARAKPYAHLLDAACVRHGYSQLEAFAQIAAESAWDPNATSGVGAIGLCQIMPATAAEWGCNPSVPAQAIEALVLHMAGYQAKYRALQASVHAPLMASPFALALAAYNAGDGAVDQYKGVPPFAETENYVSEIIGTVENSRGAWADFWRELLI